MRLQGAQPQARGCQYRLLSNVVLKNRLATEFGQESRDMLDTEYKILDLDILVGGMDA